MRSTPLTLLVLFLFVSCAQKEDRTKEDRQDLGNTTTSFIYNMIPENPQAEISLPYSSAINTFAINLLKEIEKTADFRDTNIVMSPFSVSRNLAILTEGAAGTTRDQLLSALGGQVALDDAQDALSELLYADNSVTLQCADALWFDSSKFSLQPSYKTLIESKYGVLVEGLNFANRAATTTHVNNWISDNTQNEINGFLTERDLNDSSVGILADAIYFEANWASPFDINETERAPFETPTGFVDVDMMRSGYSFSVSETETYQNAKLYYGDNDVDYFYLDLYKPTSISLAEFLETECPDALTPSDTAYYGNISLPRFFFETELDLKPVLQNLGVTDLFNPITCSLPSLFEPKSAMPNINFFVEKVKHKAGIKTDEEGTKAYAVTVSTMAAGSAAPAEPLVFDSPFVYFIRAGKNGLILFAGVVTHP